MLRKSLFLAFGILLFSFGAALAAGPGDFVSLAKEAGPAVVNINTEKVVQTSRNQFPFPAPFEEFFRGMPPDMFDRFNQAPRERKQRSLGSGFLISADGYIVTNHHVVANADSIQVSFDDSKNKDTTYKATLVGSDKDTDIAVLKIEASNLPYLKLGDSDKVQVGEWVLAIGNPFGLDHTVTSGIISAKGRNIQSGPFDSFLQTDASINPGNSGGPLLNMNGEVIGINAAIIANGQGIGFAIPSNIARDVIASLRSEQKVSRGWMGVTIQNLEEKAAKALGLSQTKGALIGDVLPGNPAAKAGMLPGDVVLSVNGAAVSSSNDLLRKIAALKPGDTASLVVWRNGGKQTVTVTIGERSAGLAADKAPSGKPQEMKGSIADILGMTVKPVTREDAARLRMDAATGLVVTGVARDKRAARAGLRPGDVLLAVNGRSLATEDALKRVLETEGKSRGAVLFHIQRGSQKAFRTVDLTDQE